MKIEFSTDNAAFAVASKRGVEWNVDEGIEISRILSKIALDVRFGNRNGLILDINGNIIGSWEL